MDEHLIVFKIVVLGLAKSFQPESRQIGASSWTAESCDSWRGLRISPSAPEMEVDEYPSSWMHGSHRETGDGRSVNWKVVVCVKSLESQGTVR